MDPLTISADPLADKLTNMGLDLASWALGFALNALEFTVPFGLLSAFLVWRLNFDSKAQNPIRHVFLVLGIASFAPVIFFFFMRILVEHMSQRTLSIPHELIVWGGWFLGGIAGAWLYLRYAPQSTNELLAKFTKSSKLERNQRTDVRQIGNHLPSAALKFDPLEYIQKRKVGDGIFLGLDEQTRPVSVNFSSGTSAPHIQVCGTTGAGKGVALSIMASQFLERGEAVFFCDPKNDEWAPSVLFAAAQRTGKPYFYLNLNRPNGPQFNPFAGATEEEAFELFQSGFSLIEKGDASDFYGIADRREASLTAKAMTQQNLNIAQVYTDRQEEMAGAEKFAGRLRELAEVPSINALAGQGVDLAKIIDEGGCIYIVGSMRNDIIKTVQRMILVRLIQLAERRDRMAGPLRSVCIVLDEVKYHLSRPALEGLGAARDKGVHLVLAHQSLGDLRDCTKDLNPDAVVDAVVENTKIKLFYRVMSPDTGEWAARMSGEILVDDESRRVTRNFAAAELVDAERNIRQAERFFIDTNMMLNLPPSVAVLYGDGLPKFVSIQPLRVAKSLEAIKIAAVVGASAPTAADSIAIPPAAPAVSAAAALISLDHLDTAAAPAVAVAAPVTAAAAASDFDDLP